MLTFDLKLIFIFLMQPLITAIFREALATRSASNASFVKVIRGDPWAPSFSWELGTWSTFTGKNSRRVECQPGFCQWIVEGQNVCFMDLAKMIIEVCAPMCVSVCFLDLVNSQFHSPFSPRLRGGAGGSRIYTNTKSLLSIYSEVELNSRGMSVSVEIFIIKGEKR